MNRVSRNIRITFSELDVDNHEIVYVVQMVTNLVCGEFASHTSNHKISRSPVSDLVGYVDWHVKLSFIPTELELDYVSNISH
jgi:hypothetical protein